MIRLRRGEERRGGAADREIREKGEERCQQGGEKGAGRGGREHKRKGGQKEGERRENCLQRRRRSACSQMCCRSFNLRAGFRSGPPLLLSSSHPSSSHPSSSHPGCWGNHSHRKATSSRRFQGLPGQDGKSDPGSWPRWSPSRTNGSPGKHRQPAPTRPTGSRSFPNTPAPGRGANRAALERLRFVFGRAFLMLLVKSRKGLSSERGLRGPQPKLICSRLLYHR